MTDEIDWDDWTFKGDVSRKIAFMLGWEINKLDPDEYWDPIRREGTGYHIAGSDGRHWFDPFTEVGDAIFAASALMDRRRASWRLERLKDRNYRSSFEVGGRYGALSGIHSDPAAAICISIYKLAEVPDQLGRVLDSKPIPPRAPEWRFGR